MMNEKEAVQSLRNEAKSNPAANAVFHVFATRQRARGTVTVAALMQRMKDEGFLYPGDKYTDILKLLAKLGFGRLNVNSKGRVTALTDVKTKLQAIGMAACGSNETLPPGSTLKPKAKYGTITAEPIAKPIPKLARIAPSVQLTFIVNGKPFSVSVPETATPDDISAFICSCTAAKDV